ncbi:autotransporter-associated beta strand repeat-containing protein [Bombella apis]|uniref:autotransporter-associated beta strand repeat-containing protein n=2 Tax=Bombella TaxID=1654741 RepID=UPI0024A9A141|nr:autotransporter-associated beta strand repeat-containing protein [Bombella apis]
MKVSARIALLLASVSSFSIISTPARSDDTAQSQQGGTVRTFSPAAGETDTVTDTITDGKGNTPLSVEQAGAGTTVLSAANSYTGTTDITQGTLALSGNGSIANSSGVTVGKNTTFDISGSSSNVTVQDLSGAGNVTLGQNGLTLSSAKAGSPYDGVISGTGGLTVDGGSKTLTNAQTYSGDTSINNGATLALTGNGNLANTRVQLNNRDVSGPSTFDISQASHPVDVQSIMWGNNGAVVNLGSNTLNITNSGSNDTNGATFKGDGATLNVSGQKQGFNGTITGNTSLVANASIVDMYGSKQFDYTGSTTVNNGSSLHVYGAVIGTPQVTVSNGGKLDGTGTIGSSGSTTTIEQGGSINPGTPAAYRQTLSIGNDLTTRGTSDFSGLQDNGSSRLSNGSISVGGNLDLGGTVKAVDLSSQQGSGVQTLFRYAKQLTTSNPTLNVYQFTGDETGKPFLSPDTKGTSYLQTGNHQVNLVTANAGDNLAFWNGSKTTADGQIRAGDGTWSQGANSATNWTTANGSQSSAWQGKEYAIFGQPSDDAIQQSKNAAQNVTVDGNVDVAGMQFSQNARPSSYSVIPKDGNSSITLYGNRYTDKEHPDKLNRYFYITDSTGQSGTQTDADIKQYEQNNGTLVNKSGLVSTIRVGDGSGYGDTNLAIIKTPIKDDPSNPTTLVKTDTGTLVLDGNNSYNGGTVITNGVLEITSDASLGAQNGTLGISGGTLRIGQDLATNANRNTVLGYNGATIDLNGHTYDNNGSIVGPRGANIAIRSTTDNSGLSTALQNAGGPQSGTVPVLNLNADNTYLGRTDIQGNWGIGGSNVVVNANDKTPFGTSDSTTKGGDLNITAGAIVNMNGGQDKSASMGNRNVVINDNSALYFNNRSVADTANITNTNNASVTFRNDSSASQSTISNAGHVFFADNATADQATVQNNSDGATVDITKATNGVSIGSLSGNGNVSLGDQTLTVGALNKDDTLSAIIWDAGNHKGSVVKTGTGTQTLTGNNSYTGSTTVNNGTLALAGQGTITNSSFVDVNKGAKLDISQSANDQNLTDIRGGGDVALGDHSLSLTQADSQHSYDGVISGTGGLKILAGEKTLTGQNTYTGDTVVAQQAGLTLDGGKLDSQLFNNGTSVLQNGAEITKTVTNDHGGTLTAHDAKLADITNGSTAGQILLDKGTTASGTLAASDGQFTIGEGGANVGSLSGSSKSTGTLNDTLTITNGHDGYNGTLSGNGGLNITGGSGEYLNGQNTYAGETHVGPNANLTLQGSITGNLRNEGDTYVNPNANTAGQVSIGGTTTNTHLFTSQNAILGKVINNDGTTTLNESQTKDIDNNAGETVLTGTTAGAITNAKGATFTTQQSQHSDGTTINNSLASADNAGTMKLDHTTVNGQTTNSGTLTTYNSGLGDVSNNAGTATLDSGTTAGHVINAAEASFTLQNSGTISSADNQGSMTLGAFSTASGNVTNTGNGSLTLDNSTIGGTLTHDGQSLTVTDKNASVGSLAGNGNGTLDGALHLTNANDTTYNGILSGKGGLALDGGKETLTNHQAYTGDTTVGQSGDLTLTGSLSGALVNNGHSALQDGSAVTGTVTNTSTGSLEAHNAQLSNVTTAGTLLLDRGTNVSGKLAATGGQFTIGDGGATVGTLSGTNSTGALNDTLTLTNAQDGYAGSLSGKGGLTIAGGTETLSGQNRYTGDTHVTSAAGAGLDLTGSIAGRLVNDQYAQVSGPNAQVKNTTINKKTLNVSNGATLADITNNGAATLSSSRAGNVTNAANATFSATGGSQASATNSGVMTLAGGNKTDGAVTNTGNGSLTLDGSTIGGTLTHDGQNLTVTSNNASAGSLAGNSNGTLDGTLTLTKANDTYNGILSGKGGLALDGGKETLTNHQAYTGDTTVGQSGDLTLTGSLSGALVNNGHSALQDGSAVTGTVTNNDGSLVANGARLANLVTNAGTVTLNDSIVRDVSSNGGQTALAGTSAGTVTNAANATFSATGGSQASTTNSGVMTLAGGNKTDGAVTNTGNGSLTLDGSTIGGTLTHDGQNLTVTSNNASAGSLAGNSNGTLDGTLILTKASDTYAGSLSGNGGLTIDGGTEILTGDSTYSGPTMIQNQATLEVDGRNGSSPVSVGNGATLRGTGTVGSTQAVSGATVAPGAIGSDALSTLHVSGNLTMAKGSVLRIRGTSDTTGQTIDTAKGNGFHELTSDRLAVTGTAYLQGGTLDLQLKNAGAGLTYGQAYRVLTASGGVNGQFDEKLSSNLAPQYAYLDPAFAYSADAVDIVLRRNASSFSTVGETRNQITTGQGLDHLAPSSALSQAMTGLTRDQARRALDNLSGELHASIRTALIQDSFYIRNAVMDRLANSDCDYGHNGQSLYDLKTHKKNGVCYSDHAVLWGQAYGALGHNSGDGNAALMHHNTAGFIMGADAPINRSNWRVGGLLSYGHSQFNIQRGRSSSGNSNNITVGAYAGTHWGRLNLRLGAAYSWNVINTRRHVAVGDYGGRLSSGYLGGTAQTFAELGYKMRTGRGVFEPFMNVAYVNMQTNSYHEHGNEAALRSRGTDTGVTFSTFGFRAATTLNIGRTIFMPHLTAAYRHGFGRLGSRQHEAFATTGGTSDMDVAGVLLSSNAAVVNAGMTARLTDRIDLDLSYIGQYGNQSTESGATGTFKMKF